MSVLVICVEAYICYYISCMTVPLRIVTLNVLIDIVFLVFVVVFTPFCNMEKKYSQAL